MNPRQDLDETRKQIEKKQRATVWPDTLNAGRTVDEFLWNGDRNATLAQRVGLAVFAAMFLFCALILLVVIFQPNAWPTKFLAFIMAVISALGGGRLLRNVFRRNRQKGKK